MEEMSVVHHARDLSAPRRTLSVAMEGPGGQVSPWPCLSPSTGQRHRPRHVTCLQIFLFCWLAFLSFCLFDEMFVVSTLIVLGFVFVCCAFMRFVFFLFGAVSFIIQAMDLSRIQILTACLFLYLSVYVCILFPPTHTPLSHTHTLRKT